MFGPRFNAWLTIQPINYLMFHISLVIFSINFQIKLGLFHLLMVSLNVIVFAISSLTQ
jgi:hypothetical protein